MASSGLPMGEVLVRLRVGPADAAWRRRANSWLPPDRAEWSADDVRRAVGIAAAQRAGQRLAAPVVVVTRTGPGVEAVQLKFVDGRHRFAVARERGEETMAVWMCKESVRLARRFGLVEEDGGAIADRG